MLTLAVGDATSCEVGRGEARHPCPLHVHRVVFAPPLPKQDHTSARGAELSYARVDRPQKTPHLVLSRHRRPGVGFLVVRRNSAGLCRTTGPRDTLASPPLRVFLSSPLPLPEQHSSRAHHATAPPASLPQISHAERHGKQSNRPRNPTAPSFVRPRCARPPLGGRGDSIAVILAEGSFSRARRSLRRPRGRRLPARRCHCPRGTQGTLRRRYTRSN